MADISIDEIKRLRSLTGVGITDAKNALVEADGDFDKALQAMRKKGLTKAEKRGEREARAGVISTYNHDNRIGVVAIMILNKAEAASMECSGQSIHIRKASIARSLSKGSWPAAL